MDYNSTLLLMKRVTKIHIEPKPNTTHYVGPLLGLRMHATISNPSVVVHNSFLEPMLILIMRVTMGHINFQVHASLLVEASVGHIYCNSRIFNVGGWLEVSRKTEGKTRDILDPH